MTSIDASDAARALAALRKSVIATCAYCGVQFEAMKTRSQPRFCSDTHKTAEYRQRNREKLNERKRLKRQKLAADS